jgi:bifunctional UDP-N-acetylglucosamine pyrophosphorylase/glucosamine-1-phosphate N-acetyltransferase
MRYAIILAAGKGTRMASQRPKPLMKICGVSMLRHVLAAVTGVPRLARVVVVVGHGAKVVEAELALAPEGEVEVVSARQPEQLGTGDAAIVGLSRLPDLLPGVGGSGSAVLVAPADAPLVRPETLAALIEQHEVEGNAVTILTMRPEHPTGYGRVVRNPKGQAVAIVEESELGASERDIDEVCTSIYAFDLSVLPAALRRIVPANAKREYYLTDVVGVLAQSGHQVGTRMVEDPTEAIGVNDFAQLVVAEERMRRRLIEAHLAAGVMMVRPETITIDAGVTIGEGVTIWPDTLLLGRTRVGAGAEIGPASRLIDTEVGERSALVSVDAVGATIGAEVRAGPYVAIREGAVVPAGAVLEPFSLVK